MFSQSRAFPVIRDLGDAHSRKENIMNENKAGNKTAEIMAQHQHITQPGKS